MMGRCVTYAKFVMYSTYKQYNQSFSNIHLSKYMVFKIILWYLQK